MKKSFLLLFFLFAIQVANSQTHSYKMGCRYFKPPVVNGKAVKGEEVCTACAKQNEDERQARIAENKRRADVAIQKAKENNDTLQAKAKKEAEERKKNEPVTAKITIGGGDDNKKPLPNKPIKSEMVAGKLYVPWLYSFWIWNRYVEECSVLLNSKGDTIKLPFQKYSVNATPLLTEDDITNIKKYRNPYELEFINSYPLNTAVILFDDGMDLINDKGERFLKEKNVFIFHLAKEYFLRIKLPYDYGSYENKGGANQYYVSEASIINSKTKMQEKLPISSNIPKSVEVHLPLRPNDYRNYASCITEKLPNGWKTCVLFTNNKNVVLCYVGSDFKPQIMEFVVEKACY